MSFNQPIRLPRLFVGCLSFALSLLLGMGAAAAIDTGVGTDADTIVNPYGMVDPISPQIEASYRIYLSKCATCHVALPPAVLPTQTWQSLVVDPAHYGLTLTDITAFEKQLIVNYLQAYSRSHQSSNPLPFKLSDSDYFRALHPQVTLPQPLSLHGCTSCHLSATTQNYRDLISDPSNRP